MTKDVLVSVKGLQFEMGSDEAVEMLAPGEYYERNGKHYVRYEEVLEGAEGEHDISMNTVKISKDQIEIMKKGGSNVHMVFAVDQKNMTYYTTPFGNLQISVFTNYIKVEEKEDLIEVNLRYDLEINHTFISNCEIKMFVMSKDSPIHL